MNILNIQNQKFEIDLETSFIKEFNENYTQWDLKINTKKGQFNSYECLPNIRIENQLWEYGNLESLIGKEISIQNEKENNFSFYLDRFSDTKSNKLTFKQIKNDKLTLHWEGIIEEIHFPELIKDVPFKLECEITIKQTITKVDYKNPSIKVKSLIDTISSNNVVDILEKITDILTDFTLGTNSYNQIIEFIASNSFLSLIEEEADEIEFFLEEFLFLETIPNSIKRKAKEQWCEIDFLNNIIEEI